MCRDELPDGGNAAHNLIPAAPLVALMNATWRIQQVVFAAEDENLPASLEAVREQLSPFGFEGSSRKSNDRFAAMLS